MNRCTYVECTDNNCSAPETCSNRTLQNKKWPLIEVIQTEKRGFGLRVNEFVPQGSTIMEFIGEYMTKDIHNEMHRPNTAIYAIDVGNGFVIDAARYGNYARYINHSCQPNTMAEKWNFDKTPTIRIVAMRDLQAYEEVSFDYRLSKMADLHFTCLCESRACRDSSSKQIHVQL